MGYRLRSTLSRDQAEDVVSSYDADPFQKRDKLPDAPVRNPDIFNRRLPEQAEMPVGSDRSRKKASLPSGSRVPQSVFNRARESFSSFMPPVEYLADYLDLVAAIEDTAAHLQLPVMIEGYTPPYDPPLSRRSSHSRPRRHRSKRPPRRLLDELVEKHDGDL